MENNLDYYQAGTRFDVAVISSNGQSVSLALGKDESLVPAVKPSAVQPTEFQLAGALGDLMPWGDGNDFPQRITELYNNDPLIPKTLDKVAAMMVARGVMAVQEDVDADGKEIDVPLPKDHPVAREIRLFLKSLDFRRYLRDASSDITWFFNAWPEMILSKDRTKIVQLHSLNAEECRWCRMTPSGDLPFVYLSGDWPNATLTDPGKTKKIDALDIYRWDKVDWVRNSSFYNFVYPISYPTPGKRYYSLAHHYSLVKSGWLEVHIDVPTYKKYLLKNQIAVKYHIKVDKDYWPLRFGHEVWTKMNPTAKQEKIRSYIDELTKTLTSAENAGKAIMTEVAYEPSMQNKMREYVQITVIEDPFKEGKLIQDNLEAAANVFYAVGVDPALVGFAGGDKLGAKSGGSDKREAYLIALQMLSPYREMILEPLEYVSEYNGWKAAFPDLTFRFRDTLLTTLDTGAGSKKVIS